MRGKRRILPFKSKNFIHYFLRNTAFTVAYLIALTSSGVSAEKDFPDSIFFNPTPVALEKSAESSSDSRFQNFVGSTNIPEFIFPFDRDMNFPYQQSDSITLNHWRQVKVDYLKMEAEDQPESGFHIETEQKIDFQKGLGMEYFKAQEDKQSKRPFLGLSFSVPYKSE